MRSDASSQSPPSAESRRENIFFAKDLELEECRQFFGRGFGGESLGGGGGPKILEKQCRTIREQKFAEEFADQFAGNFLKFAGPNEKLNPNPLCRTSGSTSSHWPLTRVSHSPRNGRRKILAAKIGSEKNT